MKKRKATAPAPVDDFRPFYLKGGKLWVPYRSGNEWYLHYLEPETAWLGINNAVRVLCSTGEVVPFALKALRNGSPEGKRAG